MQYKTTWDLKKYFYNNIDDPELKKDIKSIPKLIGSFNKKYKGKIKNFKEKDFLRYFEDINKISKKTSKIAFYLNYISELDTQDQKIIKRLGEFSFIMTEMSNKQLFIEEEFKKIGYKKLIRFSRSDMLKPYKNYFYRRAVSLKHKLDEKTEFALNLKEDSGASAFGDLYKELTNSFLFKIKIGKKEKLLTDAEIRALRSNPNPKIREKALASLREVYGDKKTQITLGNIYKAVVKDSTSEIKLRKFDSVMAMRNMDEQMDKETVNLLLKEVEDHYHLFQRYLKAKAKVMRCKKIRSADLFAPIRRKKEKKYTFKKSLDIFLKSMKDLDKEFHTYSINMLEKGRVDVFPKKGKRGGAFANYGKDFPSFILLNHTDKLDDISTLAHEMGHAIHGHLSQSQKAQVYGPPLSLAETASIFNEMILAEHLIPRLSEKEKIPFMAERLDNIFGTISRQIQYVLFEKKVHETFKEGKELSFIDFNKMWRDEQLKMTKDMVIYDVPAEKETGWSMIPHINLWPFYCYTYAFGNLLTFALYQRYKEEKENFIKDYKQILRSGGSMPPYEILKRYGFDIKKKEFYRKSFSVIEEMVKEFEELIR